MRPPALGGQTLESLWRRLRATFVGNSRSTSYKISTSGRFKRKESLQNRVRKTVRTIFLKNSRRNMPNARLLIAFDATSISVERLVEVDLASGASSGGDGDVDYACPHCRTLLLLRVDDSSAFSEILFRCPCCRKYSHFEFSNSMSLH